MLSKTKVCAGDYEFVCEIQCTPMCNQSHAMCVYTFAYVER